MFAKVLSVFALVGLVAGKPLAGVDPNTVQCDSSGLIHLLLPDYEDCTKFFMCSHGREVEFSCPAGLIFDFELQGCDWPFSGTCTLRDNPDQIEGSGDDSAWGFNAEVFDVEADDAANAEPAQRISALNCMRSENSSRQVPYKGDCQKYWRCNGQTLQTAVCTDGLFFNAQTSQCDFEANVKCDQQINNELEGEFIVYN